MAVVRCLMNLAKVPNDAMIHSPNRILPTRSVCEAGFWQGSILGHLVIRSAKQVHFTSYNSHSTVNIWAQSLPRLTCVPMSAGGGQCSHLHCNVILESDY